MYLIYPKPLLVKKAEGNLSFKDTVVYFEKPMENVFNELKTFMDFKEGNKENSNIKLSQKKELEHQAYEIEVSINEINIYASDEAGFFYAVKSLKQIYKPNMECGYVYDKPDLKVRGYMMDISRNKVPTVKTVKYIIDIMSDLKMNHLELYVEGFSFEYKSFKQYLKEDGYISIEDYQEIEKYANSQMIDLVPNQNGFGHMAEWLKQDEFKDLAEAPEGIFLWGTRRAPSTLDPSDPRSLELIKKMYADMLPYSNSKYFNMNFDEPFELGKGKSKELCEEKGLANVYLDYAIKAHEEIKKYNKQALIWGDVLINHPESLSRVPKDMIFVDWGYDINYPFEKNLLKLKEADIKFLAAPGTASWCSFLGRTNDALGTIHDSCVYTKAYGGEGMLLTDWGDFGHLQFLPTSIVPLVYSGLLSYRTDGNAYLQLKHYVNKHVLKDSANIIADLLLDLGNYYRFENSYVSNGTQAFHVLLWAVYSMKEEDKIGYFTSKMKDKILTKEKYEMMNDFFDQKLKELDYSQVEKLIKDELKHSIFFVRTLLKINQSLNESYDMKYRIKLLEEVIAAKDQLVNELRYLWLQRNKTSYLDDSIGYINKLIDFTKILLGGMYEE
ncbi:MAG: family 20 glycosylhydrolase [Bacilli bacterium]